MSQETQGFGLVNIVDRKCPSSHLIACGVSERSGGQAHTAVGGVVDAVEALEEGGSQDEVETRSRLRADLQMSKKTVNGTIRLGEMWIETHVGYDEVCVTRLPPDV